MRGEAMTIRFRSKTRELGTSLLAICLLAFATTACVGPGAPGPKAQVGAATGAAAGGLIASAAGAGPEGVIAGVLLGGLFGGAVGDSLDHRDRVYAQRTAHRSLEYVPAGTSSEWYNPDSGHSGSFTPTATYETDEGRYCREYTQTVRVGGRRETAYGTACRQPDGSWEIL
jgi:surface antigen